MINWYFGWSLILAAFITGAILGLYFHKKDFMGGYDAFRRRMARLGHIALAALGMLNILFALTPVEPDPWTVMPRAAVCMMVGGVTMPLVCFLTSWKSGFRHLFFIPVVALFAGVIGLLKVGLP